MHVFLNKKIRDQAVLLNKKSVKLQSKQHIRVALLQYAQHCKYLGKAKPPQKSKNSERRLQNAWWQIEKQEFLRPRLKRKLSIPPPSPTVPEWSREISSPSSNHQNHIGIHGFLCWKFLHLYIFLGGKQVWIIHSALHNQGLPSLPSPQLHLPPTFLFFPPLP